MQQQIPASFFVSNLSCMSAKFSPFDIDKIAITCADNFGIQGKGRLIIGQIQPNQPIKILFQSEENDAVFDCSWNEADPNVIAIGCGNGIVKVLNAGTKQILTQYLESKEEIQSVEFGHKNPNWLLASNLIGITRLFDITTQKPVAYFQTHKGCAYTCTWHPIQQNIFATSGNDGAMRLWDLNSPSNKNIASVKAHMSDTLSCDFNKYEELIATSSADKTIKLWDLRNLKAPIQTLLGHRHPVRKVKFSPHDAVILGSASYDMSVMIWNIQEPSNPLIKNHPKHTEFVVGLDFSIHTEKQICSASWDGKTMVWQWDQEQPTV
ncbi:unnamed protein product [Paramecium sonneborni]|uniref:Peroxin-7 n=1 Tax=Paramecium sonneborni TaxID=65129 RepID=A0A8S1MA98_9CILI|nr:unnamed protein product [Paramecium sonneborni]